jgi:type IX secretion system PorP/SprF family membrane protein
MKTLRFLLIAITSLLIFNTINAQQQALYSQYMFNGLVINPAYAGSNEAASLTLLSRKQWVGMEGAPMTHTFSAHTPLKNELVGVGLTVMHDQIGVSSQTTVNAAYAYRIPLGKGKLAMGLQATFANYSAELSSLSMKNIDDPVFQNNDVQSFTPNFGTGLYYYDNKFYAGFSVPQILTPDYTGRQDISVAKQARHYFFNAGYLMTLNHHFKLKPNVMVTAVEGAPINYDLNLNLLIKDVLWVGASSRSFEAYNVLMEVQLTDQLKLGYAYGMSNNDLSRFDNGSHEFMLNYVFTFYKNKVVTPRYL